MDNLTSRTLNPPVITLLLLLITPQGSAPAPELFTLLTHGTGLQHQYPFNYPALHTGSLATLLGKRTEHAMPSLSAPDLFYTDIWIPGWARRDPLRHQRHPRRCQERHPGLRIRQPER
ncbi:hypothetical protein NDU88_001092 [Pleurodeles waltl]|uniref:Uncharacterized protein n=1 Tax=Pleurodeles waltl TaxID=8319 RepID=A0AAV7S6E1_PLEWA|nr:hypothetical protein NDU88_001092 [Pleurodeles waltl]